MSNGGADKPGGTGGTAGDRDGNNGCGNDADREDDNRGNCGRPEKVRPHVKPPAKQPPAPATSSVPVGTSADAVVAAAAASGGTEQDSGTTVADDGTSSKARPDAAQAAGGGNSLEPARSTARDLPFTGGYSWLLTVLASLFGALGCLAYLRARQRGVAATAARASDT